jgi:muconolactone D-isomerase
MLFFFSVRVNPKDISLEDLWNLWDKEVESAMAAKEAGKIVSLYKIVGQRRVVGVVDVESHDELDAIFMNALPMAHYLEFEEISAVRPYESFAENVKNRWK